jgi:hypothetical protein
MTKLRKVLVEFVRSTSHIKPAFRFEIPFIKLQAAEARASINLHEINKPRDEDFGEFNDAAQAYQLLISEYGSAAVLSLYPSLTSFKPEFDAVCRRDSGFSAVAAVDADAEAIRILDTLQKIEGIGPELAKSLVAAGFDSIEAVAASPLNDLETVPGVGPSTSEQIKKSATALVLAVVDSNEPKSENPFQES